MVIYVEYRSASRIKEHFNTLNIAYPAEPEDVTVPIPSPNGVKGPGIEVVV